MFLTSDRILSDQQNLSTFDIAVIVLIAASNRIDDLRPLVPHVLDTLTTARPWHSDGGERLIDDHHASCQALT